MSRSAANRSPQTPTCSPPGKPRKKAATATPTTTPSVVLAMAEKTGATLYQQQAEEFLKASA